MFDGTIKATNGKRYFLNWYEENDKNFIMITETSKHSDECEMLECYDFEESQQ